VLTTVALTLALAPSESAAKDPLKVSENLREDVKVSGIRAHLQALQNIATMNNGTRASGTPGFDASAAYVMGRLQRAGYQPHQQVFTFKAFKELAPATFERISPDPHTYAEPAEFSTMDYSGTGDVTAAVTPVDLTLPPGEAGSSTSGCEAADFAGFPAGNVALIQRGTCTFGEKAANAQAAGASAVIIFNEGQEGRQDTLLGTLSEDTTSTIPAIGTSFAVGNELAGMPGAVVHIVTSTKITPTTTSNVIADLAPRRPRKAGKIVLLGAHLDSVPEGPGINDNGTGTATILEIAEEMAEDRPPRNPVRFAFWGAEESGLVGSTRYVASLSDEEGAKIGLDLNFDMLGSPNFIRLVYDGDGSAFGTAGPPGSDVIEHVFEQYFAAKGLALDPTAFDGRSDYKPFIDVGIPAGGLFSGAEEVKTPDEQARFGGVAGEPFDRCYHQACDTLSNVNYVGLRQLSQGAVHAAAVFADRKEPLVEAQPNSAAQRSATDSAAGARLGHQFQR
jgi:Zn-dependent M28 family amino/carboxypeptidase